MNELLNFDAQELECRPWGGESNDEVKTSLCLKDRGKNGSIINWVSSNTDVITNSGRVIRPSFLGKRENVVMTAVLTMNGDVVKKEFNFTVEPDDSFEDPQYISDELFFDKLDYSKEGMKAVEKFAAAKDYKNAKAELLKYYKNKESKNYNAEPMNIGVSYMMADGYLTLQRSDGFYRGEGAVSSNDYERISIPIVYSGIQNGSIVTYDVNSRYNECVGVEIIGRENGENGKRPVLEIITDDGTITFECIDDGVIRAGKYKDVIIESGGTLYVKTFGDFLGDDTFHSLLKFSIDGLNSAIKAANLVLYARKTSVIGDDKEIYVTMFRENMWSKDTLRWSQFKWQYSNRNGIPYQDNYEIEDGFDFEYLFQRVRFMHFKWVAYAYEQTKDERLLYFIIKSMTDFIKNKGQMRTYIRGEHVGSGWADDEIHQTLCSGWPRGLDAAERIRSFSDVIELIVKSDYMTPDCLTAILKYIMDACDALAFKSLTKPVTNLRQFEIFGMFMMAMHLPEFKEQKDWIKQTEKVMENIMFTITMEDGTYAETTGGYNISVFQNFVRFKRLCNKNGVELSRKFDERLKKFALYCGLLSGPDGESLQYGDQGSGKSYIGEFSDIAKYYGDDELLFVLTKGREGKKPDWCSYLFKESSASMMRSDWSNDATYIWTQSRGGGSHGHQDDNHITVVAKNRVLLTDAGIFTYSADDPYRQWGTSPLAHNTVAINDLKQIYGKPGKSNKFISNDVFDILSNTSVRYEGFEFTRTVTFIKNNTIIVEDCIIPDDKEQENSYKQLWHMLPTAKMSFDYDNNVIKSNFDDGVNIAVYSMDSDVKLIKADGWYDYSYRQLADSPYGYFEKSKVKGIVTFKTMLKIY